MEEWMVMQKQDKNFSRVHRLNVKMLENFFADIGYSLNYAVFLLNLNLKTYCSECECDGTSV